ncbi:sugar phosphate isomerase/epimerase family protein [Prauserella cavernicola]|uniref:TIM barrel protein n=1 Tax=Prauserella cavernicola TaxID=2800127 RepID=A0A934QW30_9PSEU|nr:TIM barrel protein [Prauserella cavernicola]MBK1787475.1 TIM barrel protein [Prauserella cavernicola]
MSAAHPLELVEAAAAAGFEHCGIRVAAPTAAELVAEIAGDERLLRELRRRLADTGVEVLDVETFRLISSPDLDAMAASLEAGRRLGARYAVASGPDPEPERLSDHLAQLCERAAELEMMVAFEFHSCYAVDTLDRALVLIGRCGAPNLVLLVDLLHLVRTGGGPPDLARVDPRLIPYVQVCDAVRDGPVGIEARRVEARTDRRLLGEGELDLAGLLGALPVGIPFSVETPTMRLRDLPFIDQARVVAETTRAFLDSLPTDSRTGDR